MPCDFSSGPSSKPSTFQGLEVFLAESSDTLTFHFIANYDSQEFAHKELQEFTLSIHKPYFMFIFQTKSQRPIMHNVRKYHLSLYISKVISDIWVFTYW